MMKFFAQISGLHQLAQIYPNNTPTDYGTKLNHTIKIGVVRYRNCVNIEPHAGGLSLWVHPSLGRDYRLLIPWNQIKSHQKAWLYGRRAVQLMIEGKGKGTLTIYKGFFEMMEPFMKKTKKK